MELNLNYLYSGTLIGLEEDLEAEDESTMELVDTSKYDIVEKPEYKKERLLEEKAQQEKWRGVYTDLMAHYSEKRKECFDELEAIEKELKELE